MAGRGADKTDGKDAAGASGPVIRVLIVEDHETVRFSLKRAIGERTDMSVAAEAITGLEAVEAAHRTQPSVVLMDIGLPELNGIDATRRIKAELPDTRVIILTSFDDPERTFASLAAGADAYCVKSITMECLFDVIRQVDEGHAYLDPTIAGHVVRVYDLPEATDEGEEEVMLVEAELMQEPARLSPRESQVLLLLVEGLSDAEIASRLGLADSTVGSHVRKILKKLSVADRTQAALMAAEQRFV